jgi:hypothetical protein
VDGEDALRLNATVPSNLPRAADECSHRTLPWQITYRLLYQGWTIESATAYLNVLYFYLTAPAGGSQDALSGWVKVVFVMYLLTALWLIALVFEASTKRLGRSS